MRDSVAALGGCSYANVYGVPIQGVLHQLRTNARLNKIDLPARFAVQRDDPNHEQWRAEIAAYQKLAHARLTVFRCKLSHELSDRCLRGRELPEIPHLAAATAIGNSNCITRF